jgi:hypothetical protein
MRSSRGSRYFCLHAFAQFERRSEVHGAFASRSMREDPPDIHVPIVIIVARSRWGSAQPGMADHPHPRLARDEARAVHGFAAETAARHRNRFPLRHSAHDARFVNRDLGRRIDPPALRRTVGRHGRSSAWILTFPIWDLGYPSSSCLIGLH